MKLERCLVAAFAATTMIVGLPGCSDSPKRESAGEYVEDAAITAKVKAALAADPVVKATQVKVETYKGIVQLSGFVDSPEAVRRAAEVAREVKGVRQVKNNILVKPK